MAETIKDTEAEAEQSQGQRDSKAIVARWLRELDAADRHERDWRERAEKVVKLYRDEREKLEANPGRRYNILYANTEVLKGALYSQVPAPDVRRRFLDKDHVGRVSAMVLNRALVTAMDRVSDGEDFDSVMKDSVMDMVLPGRAVARVKYKPTIEKYDNRVEVEAPAEGATLPEDVEQDEQGYFRMEPVEEVVYECVDVEYVEWSMFRYSPAKRWKKVRWVAFGELLTRDDLIAQFGEEVGAKVEMKWMPKGMEDSEENAIFKRALVWTIWNKPQRKVVVVTDGYKEAPLQEVDDPLKLEGFFPMPRPLYSIFGTDTLIPTPEYVIYQDHATQLDEIEERIHVLTDALRRRGVYDADVEELQNLANSADNKFVPVKKWREFLEKGGLDAAFQELDISGLAKVILELMNQAEAKKQQIYEVVGISDIMRGATKATETLGAQQIKNQWGSVRVGPRQAEVQRFARDLVRLQAEVIAEHFSAQTLAQMTGIELFMSAAEKQQAMAVQPDDPRLKRPTWEDVLQVLRSDKLRSFKVDIETDSTIKHRADEEQKNRVELISSVTGFLEKAIPAVQSGAVPKKLATELLMFGVRGFAASPQIEELLDEWAGGSLDQQGPQQDDQAKAAQQAEMQAQAQHQQSMRKIEADTATANMVQAKAKAYGELIKAENLEPGIQMDLLRKRAQLAGIMDPGAAMQEAAPMGAPEGTLQ